MQIRTNISSSNGIDLIQQLKKLDGAISYDGDASVQVIFQLKSGKTLRFGVTDDDVTENPGVMWIDQITEFQDIAREIVGQIHHDLYSYFTEK